MTRTLFLAAALLAGCGEPPADRALPAAPPQRPAAPAPAAGTPGSCAVLDPAVVSEAAGLPMRVTSPPGSSGCSLASAPENLVIEGMSLERSGVFDQVAAHEAAEAIAGVPDAYYVQVEGATLGQLHVARGQRMLVVTLHADREGPDLRAIAARLARGVESRLVATPGR